jgi:hypothetical protein
MVADFSRSAAGSDGMGFRSAGDMREESTEIREGGEEQ